MSLKEFFVKRIDVKSIRQALVIKVVDLFSSKGKKPAVKPVVEMGTQQNADIDYDWLPKETTTEFGKLYFT